MNEDVYLEAQTRIDAIEAELEALGMRRSKPPAPERMAFEHAFGADKLSFEEWLMFVFVERVRDIIRSRGVFPESSSVGTKAVREFDGEPRAERLTRLLAEFDDFVIGLRPRRPTGPELEYAADAGDPRVVADLLARGATPTVTAVAWAISRGSLETLRLLLDAGADPNARDGHGVTPIFFAASGGHTATCAFLVEPDTTDIDASFWPKRPIGQHADALALLLDRGADPNQRFEPKGPYSGRGATPLITAAAFGCVPCLKLLLTRGAGAADRDGLGLTARDWAARRGHAEIVALLS